MISHHCRKTLLVVNIYYTNNLSMNKDAKLEKGQDSTYKWTTQQQISNHSLFASEWHVPERKQVFFVKPPDTANAIPFHFSSS